ncbi:MAG: hypothetical protein WCA46_27150, partial [Actinocatenispora sp.]
AARAAADAAARAAGVTVRTIAEPAELGRLCALFSRVWQEDADHSDLTPVVLRALAYAGNYVSAAYHGDTLVGGCVGFLGMTNGEAADPSADPDGDASVHAGADTDHRAVPGTPRHWELHSHAAGVGAEARTRHVGFALKLHQRAWALDHALDRISWTFDPLVGRNAYFNLSKLAARPRTYLAEFYGAMTDGINAGDESDRLVVEWRLTDPAVDRACLGRPDPLRRADLLATGAGTVLAADASGGPVVTDTDAATVLVGVPSDVEALRAVEPRRALAWRHALRDVLGGLLADGAVVTGFAREGCYVVRRGTG